MRGGRGSISWDIRSDGSTNLGGGGGSEGGWISYYFASSSLSSNSGASGEKTDPLFLSCPCLPLHQEGAIIIGEAEEGGSNRLVER